MKCFCDWVSHSTCSSHPAGYLGCLYTDNSCLLGWVVFRDSNVHLLSPLLIKGFTFPFPFCGAYNALPCNIHDLGSGFQVFLFFIFKTVII